MRCTCTECMKCFYSLFTPPYTPFTAVIYQVFCCGTKIFKTTLFGWSTGLRYSVWNKIVSFCEACPSLDSKACSFFKEGFKQRRVLTQSGFVDCMKLGPAHRLFTLLCSRTWRCAAFCYIDPTSISITFWNKYMTIAFLCGNMITFTQGNWAWCSEKAKFKHATLWMPKFTKTINALL